MKFSKRLTAMGIVIVSLSSCAIIRPGEVGVKQKIGKLSNDVLEEGAHAYNPFTTKVIMASIRTENLQLSLNLPSKEGLNVFSEISILFHLEKSMVPDLITTVGLDYYSIITSVFRSASADVCSQFVAKDMHSGRRSEIEKEIRMKMDENLGDKGITIESVLLKTIKLPDGLYNSIENRMEAEQEAMRMKYIIEQEKLDAERKIIEAKGTRDAQIILSEGLTDEILKLKSIEAFVKLAEKDGAKVIVSGSKMPLMLAE